MKTGNWYKFRDGKYCYICLGYSPGDDSPDYCLYAVGSYRRIGFFAGGLIRMLEPIEEKMDSDVITALFESRTFEDRIVKMSNIEFAK